MLIMSHNGMASVKQISKLFEFVIAVMMKIPQVRYMHTIGVIVLATAITRPGERCHGQRVPYAPCATRFDDLSQKVCTVS
jgi:hypothetical protein